MADNKNHTLVPAVSKGNNLSTVLLRIRILTFQKSLFLALQPKILVLDEPTTGLDPRGAREMLSLFKELNEKGTTIILVTHDVNIVFEYATDVIVMNEGKVEVHCSPKDLFKEDVENYSLETPLIQKTVNLCLEKGLNINVANIRNIHDLAVEIARAKK